VIINIYDKDMELIGVVENHRSLLWRRKFYEVGNFELHMPMTQYNAKLSSIGNLVSFNGTDEAGVVENILIQETSSDKTIVLSGRFLASYMDRRLIRPRLNFNGKVEVAMRKILTDAVPLPRVEIGPLKGYEEEVEFQATYKNLLDYETKLSMYADIGYRFTPDFGTKKIVFDLYKGVDRSFSQDNVARIEFSEAFGNIEEAKKNTVATEEKNVYYVGGQGEGLDRVIVQVGDNSLSGLERKEAFISATDLSPQDLTDAQYRNVLTTRGHQKLAEAIEFECVEFTTLLKGNFEYRKDYDVGDIVTVRKESWGLSQDLRLTEILEIYESEIPRIEPTFGFAVPTTIDWEDK